MPDMDALAEPRPLSDWRTGVVHSVSRWAAVAGAPLALVSVLEVLRGAAAANLGFGLMLGAYTGLVVVRFAGGSSALRGTALSACFLGIGAAAMLWRPAGVGPLLALTLAAMFTGLLHGRRAAAGVLVLSSAVVVLTHGGAPGGRPVEGVAFLCIAGVMVALARLVVGRLESALAERTRAMAELAESQRAADRAREALETARGELARSQKLEAVGRLAAGIAHDFNNMLQVVLGWTAVAQEQASSPAVRDALREIDSAARGSARLARQLLSLSRPELGAPARLELAALLPGLVEGYRRALPDSIAVELAVTSGADVEIDELQLTQVLLNLLLNARDAMPGGGTVRLTARPLTTAGAPDTVELAVADDGVGMDEATRSRVFEPFFTTKGAAGTGLGLATAYAVVTNAGGTISIDSAPGRGTTVRLVFPRAAGPG